MKLIFFFLIIASPGIGVTQTTTVTTYQKNETGIRGYVPPVVTKTYTIKPLTYTPPVRSATSNSSNTSSSVSSVGNSRSNSISSSSGLYTPATESVTPTTAVDYYWSGINKYVSEEQYDAAIAYFQKAVELDPSDVQSYLFIGLSKYKLKDYAGSIPHFNKTIELEPKHDIAYVSRADSKLMMEDYKGAIEDYSKSIALYGSGYASTYYSRAIARYNLKDYIGAVEDYTKTITLCDETQKAWDEENQKEYAKLNSNARKEAIAKAGRAIEREPMYAGSFSKRGVAKMQLGDVQAALTDYNRAIEVNPKVAENYYTRGIINFTIPGNKDAGCSDLNKALELGFVAAANVIKKYCQ